MTRKTPWRASCQVWITLESRLEIKAASDGTVTVTIAMDTARYNAALCNGRFGQRLLRWKCLHGRGTVVPTSRFFSSIDQLLKVIGAISLLTSKVCFTAWVPDEPGAPVAATLRSAAGIRRRAGIRLSRCIRVIKFIRCIIVIMFIRAIRINKYCHYMIMIVRIVRVISVQSQEL